MDDQEFAKALLEIKKDRSHGASELARQCLALLAQSSDAAPATTSRELFKILRRRCDSLIAVRPSMAPIQNLLNEWRSALTQLEDCGLQLLRSSAAELAREGGWRSLEVIEKVVENSAGYIGEGKCIITHSLSSTLLTVFERLRHRGISIIATESRPLNEGHILVERLAQLDIPTQLITEAQLGLFVSKADLALLGADSLLPDGSVVNKVGSYLLALAAHDANVPLIVCCESYKQRRADAGEPELEEMEAAELGAPSLPNVEPRNIYFDITPASLIDGWINENGVYESYPSKRSLHET